MHSGCSSDRKFFENINEKVKTEVRLADGPVIRSAGIGKSFLKCFDANIRSNIVLVRVCYLFLNWTAECFRSGSWHSRDKT